MDTAAAALQFTGLVVLAIGLVFGISALVEFACGWLFGREPAPFDDGDGLA